jgi:hypothetical protein
MPQRDGIEVADRASGGFSSERITYFSTSGQHHARYRRIQNVISELPRRHETAFLAGFVRWRQHAGLVIEPPHALECLALGARSPLVIVARSARDLRSRYYTDA